ncbi:MAG: hypothetical protein IT410_01760 [Candidatus Doudnabacteria bacterium]|nr:hypothetical protein [Candidatus Doudnabacteria bacterium]
MMEGDLHSENQGENLEIRNAEIDSQIERLKVEQKSLNEQIAVLKKRLLNNSVKGELEFLHERRRKVEDSISELLAEKERF